MTITVSSKTDLVVPQSVRREAGIKSGDTLEFRVSGGIINIIPALPSAADEYSPTQRGAIDARLAEARKGPYYGPFDTADEAIRFLRKAIGARKTKKSASIRKHTSQRRTRE
jgi:AbrB family looped-hinge helix DNA binding protein